MRQPGQSETPQTGLRPTSGAALFGGPAQTRCTTCYTRRLYLGTRRPPAHRATEALSTCIACISQWLASIRGKSHDRCPSPARRHRPLADYSVTPRQTRVSGLCRSLNSMLAVAALRRCLRAIPPCRATTPHIGPLIACRAPRIVNLVTITTPPYRIVETGALLRRRRGFGLWLCTPRTTAHAICCLHMQVGGRLAARCAQCTKECVR